ncbi:MAG: IPT/TIG domain-containing protein, partial [Flammeovirgaceae bacterium]
MNAWLKITIGLAICTTLLACSKKDDPPPTTIPAPSVTAFTPTTAAQGATVTITGTDFTGTTAVSFGGTAAASFTVVSTTSITAVVGAGASGNVSVTTGKGTAILSGFTYTVAPPVQKGLVIHHANTNQCYGKAITTDANDNIIAAELFQTNINGKAFTSAGTIDALFSKYDKNGNLIWDKTAGGANCITTPHGVETDAVGNVFVTGYFGQTTNATGRSISFDTKTITSKSDYDVFLAKYNSAGSIQWALALGNSTGVT